MDDDCYLILNDERTYGSRFESNVDLESFSIFFRPGLAEEVFGALGRTVERALADGAAESPRAVEFAETLQPHDAVVSPVLRYVQHGVNAGVEDADWYEEQFQFLLERMLSHHLRLTERILRLPVLKSATQREIHRRLTLAVDLVHASYERDIGLCEMARAACLSKFHFLRLFTELYGHHAARLSAAQARESRRPAAGKARPGGDRCRPAGRFPVALDDGAAATPLVARLNEGDVHFLKVNVPFEGT